MVISIRSSFGVLTASVIYTDLDEALAEEPSEAEDNAVERLPEWRIHFHLPLHAPNEPPLETTSDHVLTTLDLLADNPNLCSHLEMETYTWEVLPPELRSHGIVEHLAADYEWLLPQLTERGLASR